MMSIEKLLYFVLSMMLLTACTATEPTTRVIFDQHIGWMQGNCLAIKNAELKVASEITVLHLDGEQQMGVVEGKAGSGEKCPALLPDRNRVNRSSGYQFYRIKTPKPVGVAVGFIGDMPVDAFSVSVCTTLEGLKFQAHKYHAVVWEGYDYLGYELSNNEGCRGN